MYCSNNNSNKNNLWIILATFVGEKIENFKCLLWTAKKVVKSFGKYTIILCRVCVIIIYYIDSLAKAYNVLCVSSVCGDRWIYYTWLMVIEYIICCYNQDKMSFIV